MQPLLVREVIFQCPPAENTYISAQARQGIEKIRNKEMKKDQEMAFLHYIILWDKYVISLILCGIIPHTNYKILA